MSTGNGNDNGRPPQPPQGPRPPPLPRAPRLDDVRPNEVRTMPPAGQTGNRTRPQQPYAGAARPRPAHRPPPREHSTALTVVWMTLAGLGVLAAVAVAFLLIAPPVDFLRQQAITAVKQETGRDLVIRGPASFTIYPNIGISLRDVALSAPPGMGGPPTVTMQQLDVAVSLMPLIEKRVEVKQLVLTRPAFNMRVDKQGRSSWDMTALRPAAPLRFAEAAPNSNHPPRSHVNDAAPATAAPIMLAQATGNGRPAGKRSGGGLDDLSLADVQVVAGTLDYSDERSGVAQRFASIDASLSASTLSSPLKAKGDLDWRGQSVTFDGTLTTLAGLLADKPAKLLIDVKSKPLDATYTGTLETSSGAVLDGTVKASAPSLRALAQWLGETLPANDGFGPLAVSGRLKSTTDSVTLDNADITLDATRAVGRIAAVAGSARPHVKAELKIAELNLNTYISTGIGTGTGATPAAAKAARPAASPAAGRTNSAPSGRDDASPQSIEELLDRQSGPRVKGYTARSGWSDEPIDVALLDLFDADAKLSVGRLIVRDIKVGQSDLVLALQNRVARTTFERVQLYDGTGRGTITIDGSGTTPTIAANLVVDGIAAAPLLRDAADIDWLAGRGRLTVAVTAQGATERQLVAKLEGRVETVFADGAVSGFNVGKVVRGLGQGKLTGLQSSPAEKTDFSQLSASFDIADGIATNKDLTLVSPLLRVSGAGRVILPERQIDYLVRPKIVSDGAGQGGAIDLAGIEVPVQISGSWDRPSFTPDLSKIDAGQAVKAVEQIGKSLKGKNADEIVDDLFGKDSKEGQKAKKFLDKLFR